MITMNNQPAGIPSQPVLINATAAQISQEFYHDGIGVMTVSQTGIAGAETIALQKSVNGTWIAAIDSAGAAVTLTTTITSISILGAGRYRLNKGITAGTVVATLN